MKNSNSTPLKNYLTWSAHKMETYHQCNRRYFYQTIEAWQGWEPDAPLSKRYSYLLKCVIPDLRLVTGTIVHDRCGRVLQRLASGLTSRVDDEIRVAEDEFDRFLDQSRKIPLESVCNRRKKLLAHVYEREIPQANVDEQRESIRPMLEAFFGLREIALFSANPSLLLRDFIEAQFGEPSFELGVPARLITDAVYQNAGITWVLDWKTGRGKRSDNGDGQEEEPHRDQGVVYDIYIRERLGLKPEQEVRVRFYYLRDGTHSDFQFSQEDRNDMKWQIGEAFAVLQSKSDDPVINCGTMSKFPTGVGYGCLKCPHQILCGDFSSALAKGTFDRWIE
jgi:hypothetical protein